MHTPGVGDSRFLGLGPGPPELAQTADLVKPLKYFFVHYKAWIMAMLAPLGGVWAVFLIAFLDSSFLGIPVDPMFAYYVAIDPRRIILFAVMASLGSALGSTVPYLIGYKGGEELIVKKIGRERFARMHARSERYGDLALIIPAIMPPGFPFKPFVFMAGVIEMRYLHFLLSIFVGRLLRFIILGGLIVAYGPQILSFLRTAFHQHRGATFAVIAAIAAVIVLLVRRGRSHPGELTETIVA
jgi:membrane protein YqaA with SNARE-associated domain